jgi:serine/threonine protein kinase/Tol biopolymer transport system component
MALSAGTILGRYEIVAPLGAGGMGEVYRANDRRLDRVVAIKILPANIAADPASKQRFEREAKTISSLNHPNICVLHDIGHQDGLDYIVMECVEGESLVKRLEKGPLPLEQTLKIGAQIADALDKAHRSGIVHRDLKPGNIMLTPSGAKLLDFGLAKQTSPIASLATITSASPHSPITQQGTIVGTFQYMSPEQVQGQELDGRSDIFSLGAVLYEMLTGKRAFEGKTQLSVASAILESEPPPLNSIKPLTPVNLDRAIRRSLAKDRDDRWQTARDFSSELKWIGESSSQTPISATNIESRKTPLRRNAMPWLLCGLLAAALVAVILLWSGAKNNSQAGYFYAQLPFTVESMAMAPDGRTVAAIGKLESERAKTLWLYEVGSRRARSLADTEGAVFPFWSPDGKSLAFFAEGKLKKLDIAGGPVQIICDAPTGRGGTWNKDGVIIFTPSGQLGTGLYRVSASGGTATPITVPDASRGEDTHRWPMFLPDQKHFLYLAANVSGKTEPDAIYVGALNSNDKKFVIKATANAVYVAPGYLFYYREKTLFAQRFDAAKSELTGEAIPTLTDIAYLPRIVHAAYAVSDAGSFVAQSGSGVALSRLVWYDRKGNETGMASKPDVYSNIELAPDGKTVALDKTDEDSTNADIWTYDIQRDAMRRLTFNPAIDSMPVWSPDGTRILFASSRNQKFDLFVKNADGGQEEKLLDFDNSAKADKYPYDWSRDGKYILYTPATELWVATLPELKARAFQLAPGMIRNAKFSPDGKWVAYASNESGKFEIYVTSFPAARGKWQVSSAGGTQPHWRGDAKELFYIAADGIIMAVPVSVGANFDAGAPAALFQAHARELIGTSEQVSYDVTKDGQRFLINTQVKNADTHPMSVILNWDAEMKKK